MMQMRCKEKKRIGNATGLIDFVLVKLSYFPHGFFYRKKTNGTNKRKEKQWYHRRK
jgi:hypothetical protein